MAEIDYVITNPSKGVRLVTWLGLANGDTGKPFKVPNTPDKTVTIDGTFGTGGQGEIQGSNEDVAAPSTYHIVDDVEGAALTAIGTPGRAATIIDDTHQMRPRVIAGTGVSMNFRLRVRGNTK